MDVTLSRDHNITTGKIYKEVIEKEVRPISFPTPLSQAPWTAPWRLSRQDSPGIYVALKCPHHLQINLQIVPHVTNAIQDWIERVAKIPVDETDQEPNVCIIEVLPLLASLFLML